MNLLLSVEFEGGHGVLGGHRGEGGGEGRQGPRAAPESHGC